MSLFYIYITITAHVKRAQNYSGSHLGHDGFSSVT